jgi:site-specific DNA-methyltransferase (adenine-specific)
VTRDSVHAGAAEIRLVQGDSLVELAALDAGSVDVVVTSPPYNLGIDYAQYDDRQSRDEYLDWTARWMALVKRVLSPRGSFFLNIAGKPKDPWGPFEVAGIARRSFALQNTIYWVKSIAVELPAEAEAGTVSVGHYKPINSKRFLNDCVEFVFHFTHEGTVELDRLAIGVEYADKSNVTRWKAAGADRHCRGNAWFVPYSTIQSRDKDRPHPASFPPELADMAIRLHGLERTRGVLDPFSGIGSTALACAALEVNHLGIEIDPVYHAEAVRRVGQAARAAAGRSSGEAARAAAGGPVPTSRSLFERPAPRS